MTAFLTTPGTFIIGANYWASHAGAYMWSDWDPAVVESDLQQLSEAGLHVLRVFPTWPDFQPIRQFYSSRGEPYEIRIGYSPLNGDEFGQAGINPLMMERFRVLADLAEKYHLKLVVALLTGWMSFRLFTPPALEGLNVLSDPLAIMWEVKFVRTFVRFFKNHPAILAWALGNECNCMAPLPDREAAYAWTAAISGAIQREDPSRPIVSSMHSLDEPTTKKSAWRIQDQSELVDILTTHPYPIFTPYCNQEPINTIRPLLHSTAQTRWYGDVGQKPAYCEEIGTLGPTVASDSVTVDFLRTELLSLWANDCRGLLWWCAFDANHLATPPYDWVALEREQGLFRVNQAGQTSPRPIVSVMQEYRAFLNGLPFPTLPRRVVDAVCILSDYQEPWAAAYSSFILAKQAGIELEFQDANQPLRDARAYFVPSITSGIGASLTRHFWVELMETVRQGALLYLSNHDEFISSFEEVFGLEVVNRQRRSSPAQVRWIGSDNRWLTIPSPIRSNFRVKGAQVLAEEPDGNPVFTRNRYGQGWVYYLSVPLETGLVDVPGAFDDPQNQPYWQIYSTVAQSLPESHIIKKDHPLVGVTEHPLDESSRVAIAINYSPEPIRVTLQLTHGWQITETLRGEPYSRVGESWQCSLPANDGSVVILTKA